MNAGTEPEGGGEEDWGIIFLFVTGRTAGLTAGMSWAADEAARWGRMESKVRPIDARV